MYKRQGRDVSIIGQFEEKSMRHYILGLIFSFVAVLSLSVGAKAQVEIDLRRGNVEPLPIAIMNFEGDQVAQDISNVIEADLRNSGLFRPIEKAAFLQTTLSPNSPPKFEDWRTINAQALVNGSVRQLPNGKLRAEFRLWDIFGTDQIAGERFDVDPKLWRRVAHIIADRIYDCLLYTSPSPRDA